MEAIPPNETPEKAMARRREERSKWPVRKGRMDNPTMEEDDPSTPEERLAMIWPITEQVYTFAGVDVAKSRIPRHLMRLTRRES